MEQQRIYKREEFTVEVINDWFSTINNKCMFGVIYTQTKSVRYDIITNGRYPSIKTVSGDFKYQQADFYETEAEAKARLAELPKIANKKYTDGFIIERIQTKQ